MTKRGAPEIDFATCTADEVADAIETHGKWIVHVPNEHSELPLHQACKNETHGGAIIRLLLAAGALLVSIDNDGFFTIHVAMWHGNIDAVAAILENNGHIVAELNVDRQESPCEVLLRSHLVTKDTTIEALLRLIAPHAAIHDPDIGDKILHSACLNSSSHVVSLCFELFKPNIDSIIDNVTPLMRSISNDDFGLEVADLLLKSGASTTIRQPTDEKHTIFTLAVKYRPEFLYILKKHVAPAGQLVAGAAKRQKITDDPLAMYREMMYWGYKPKTLSGDTSLNLECWYSLRFGAVPLFHDRDTHDWFKSISNEPSSSAAWDNLSRELRTVRHPITGCTLLHIAAANSIEAVRKVARTWINPLVPNKDGKLAVDCAATPEIAAFLRTFATWRPHHEVTWWYGPHFERRAFAFLLVCKRHHRPIPKDIRHLIIAYIAALETTFVLF